MSYSRSRRRGNIHDTVPITTRLLVWLCAAPAASNVPRTCTYRLLSEPHVSHRNPHQWPLAFPPPIGYLSAKLEREFLLLTEIRRTSAGWIPRRDDSSRGAASWSDQVCWEHFRGPRRYV